MKKYIVREGDTMWEISQATGVRLNLLLAANPQIHDPNQLQPGSLLVIPELGKQAGVGPGANPQPFAMPHSQTPATPAPMPQPQSAPMGMPQMAPQDAGHPAYFGFVWPHVVTPGETWDRIAAQYGVAVAQLRRMNPELSQRPLQAGQLVYVPSPGTPPSAQGMPTQGMPVPGMPAQGGMAQVPLAPQVPQAPAAPSEGVGPHTHNPYYRSSVKKPGAHPPYPPAPMPYSAPSTSYSAAYLMAVWCNDWDESSAWDSDASSGAKMSDD